MTSSQSDLQREVKSHCVDREPITSSRCRKKGPRCLTAPLWPKRYFWILEKYMELPAGPHFFNQHGSWKVGKRDTCWEGLTEVKGSKFQSVEGNENLSRWGGEQTDGQFRLPLSFTSFSCLLSQKSVYVCVINMSYVCPYTTEFTGKQAGSAGHWLTSSITAASRGRLHPQGLQTLTSSLGHPVSRRSWSRSAAEWWSSAALKTKLATTTNTKTS